MKARSVKILTYNTCYGLKANTLLDAHNATWRVVHKRKNPEEISKKSDFSQVFEIIKKENPSVVVLNEIFDNLQTRPVFKELKRLGLNNIFIGNSGHHATPLTVSTVIATTHDCEHVKTDITFPKGIPGTGGGAVGVYIKEVDLFLLGLHIAYTQDVLSSQLKELDDFYLKIKDKYKNIIFAGDLNREYDFYKKFYPIFKDFSFVKGRRTFPSFFPVYAPFRFLSKNLVMGQVDNIFYKGNISVTNSEVIDGKRSDHKPLVASLRIKDPNML